MKTYLAAVGALMMSVLAFPAGADIVNFTGAFAPASWTTTVIGDVNPAGPANDGSIVPSAVSVAITGGNDPTGNPDNNDVRCSPGNFQCEIRYTHPTLGIPSFSFHWSYASLDSAGAQLDQFGAIVDGLKINLSDPGGLATQSGDRTFAANSSIGWFVNCADCVGGSATATISAFLAVPEPGSLALLGLGLAGLGAFRRKLHA